MSNVVEMGKKYNLYSWSAQAKSIAIRKAEGITSGTRMERNTI